jgi:hypothetical protein
MPVIHQQEDAVDLLAIRIALQALVQLLLPLFGAGTEVGGEEADGGAGGSGARPKQGWGTAPLDAENFGIQE